MSKTTLWFIIVALTTFAVNQTVVALRYEYHNDRLNLALGQCIGVKKVTRQRSTGR